MNNGITEVWYACYGSNIREERFMCYIEGGTPPGALKNFTGCRDTSKPRESRAINIDHEMYFAQKAPTWNNGGICFLNPEKNAAANTLGRTYLINSEQFIDLVKQELNFEGEIHIDFEELAENGSYNCLNDGRYGLLLYLGEIDGAPIVTFTSEVYLQNEINKPDKEYLRTIIRGIREIYTLSDLEILEYLQQKKGIENLFSINELLDVVKMS